MRTERTKRGRTGSVLDRLSRRGHRVLVVHDAAASRRKDPLATVGSLRRRAGYLLEWNVTGLFQALLRDDSSNNQKHRAIGVLLAFMSFFIGRGGAHPGPGNRPGVAGTRFVLKSGRQEDAKDVVTGSADTGIHDGSRPKLPNRAPRRPGPAVRRRRLRTRAGGGLHSSTGGPLGAEGHPIDVGGAPGGRSLRALRRWGS